jgi:hypothetical protein
MKTVIKAQRPADFLLALPRFLGYTPGNSIVIQTFHTRQTAASLRIDLPEVQADTSHRLVADSLMRLISRVPGVDAVLIVIYTAEAPGFDGRPPRADLTDEIVRRMSSAGLDILDALIVGSESWVSALDAESGSLAELAGGSMEEQLNSSGLIEPLGLDSDTAQRSLGALVLESAEARALVVEACRPITASQPRRKRLGEPGHALMLWREALEVLPVELTPEQMAPLLWSIRDKGIRDCVLMELAWGSRGGRLAARDSEALNSGGSIGEDSILATFVGDGLTAPSGLRLECAIRLLRHLAAHSPEPWRLAPLTMLAWLEWARGSGTAAGGYLDAALLIGPGYELARLFRTLINTGRVPDWVGRAPL